MKRTGDHLKNVKKALVEWRFKTRRASYKHTSLKAENVLPDPVLKSIASRRRGIKTIDDLRRELSTPWHYLDRHGEEVLQLVRKLDTDLAAARKIVKQEKATARKLATERKKAEEVARKQAVKAAASSQRQWAQTVSQYAGPMGSSAALNAPSGGVFYYYPCYYPQPHSPSTPTRPSTPFPQHQTTPSGPSAPATPSTPITTSHSTAASTIATPSTPAVAVAAHQYATHWQHVGYWPVHSTAHYASPPTAGPSIPPAGQPPPGP